MTSLLQLEGIQKRFGGVQALDGAALEVRPGEILTLLGENGAGKSTLVKIIAGVVPPDAGTIRWDGETLDYLDVNVVARLGIRIIYQRLTTVPHLSVGENLSLGREPVKWGFIRTKQEAIDGAESLARLGVSLDLDQFAGGLPVAERQLIEIARALHGNVRLLIMDEPTASLGEREVERLFSVMTTLRDAGVALVFISHKLEEVLEISDRITVLRDGSTVDTLERSEASRDRLVEKMVGRRLATGLHLKRAEPGTEVALEAKALSSDTGLQDVSFELHRGEVLGVYGLMGAGRTELARVLCGADRPSAGEILVDGTPVEIKDPGRAKRLGIGFVPEERQQGSFDGLSIRENISSASGDLIARLGILDRDRERRLAQAAATDLDVRAPSVETIMAALSGGNQQKVLVGRWLVRKPRILLLDDPTSGIDVGAKAEIYQLIAEQTEHGLAVLMTSSELPELLEIANRILVLHRGRSMGILEGGDLNQQAVVELALGHAAASPA